MRTIQLEEGWQVRHEPFSCKGIEGLQTINQAIDGWLPAEEPGEIHLDLMRAGMMPDPSVSDNMPKCRWVETRSWWYRLFFELDDRFKTFERQEIVFDGLDLYAQIFLNGKMVGECADAFVPQRFDVKSFLQVGKNELVVRLTAGNELALDETPAGQNQPFRPNSAANGEIPNPMKEGDLYGHRMWPGRKWLRKPQFTYGWDWVDALPNIGIWRGVHLEGRTYAVLHDIRLDTLRQDGKVSLEMEAVVENIHPWSERPCRLEIEIYSPQGKLVCQRQYAVAALPGKNYLKDIIEVPDAQLWYPNGVGEQPLYQVKVRVMDRKGTTTDAREMTIGLRTIEIDRSPLKEGSRFCIRVNGQDVFCRGVNIGPHDAILARITDEKYERLVAEAKNAHVNMIRINGCSIYERDVFYQACDRAGIMIWHDLPLTDITYPDYDRAFCWAVQTETETAIRLLRHHPCIALWCSNNENIWFFTMINQDQSLPLDIGGHILYNQILPEVCHHLDPRRPYWVSSPAGGEDPNSEFEGNCHWWHPFFMNPDVNRRIRHEVFDECRARFVTEYGAIGPCHLDSIQEYLLPEDMKPGTKAWMMHTNTFEKETVPAAIRLHYADPENLSIPEYVQYGQMFQAIIHGHAMEALRFRKFDPEDDCQGALIWSYSDCWGETGWSILDYYLRRKASYYWFRRACQPVKVIVRQRGDRLVTRVINDTLQPLSCTVEYGWYRLDGMAKETQIKPIQLSANSMLEIAAAQLPSGEERNPRQWLYAAILRREDGSVFDQNIWTLLPHRQLELLPSQIQVVQIENGFEISSPVYCHAVHFEDHGREVLSDNWFDLLPGVPKRLIIAKGVTPGQINFQSII